MILKLERRREALVLRSRLQRARLAVQLAPAARKLAVADRAIAALRAHPIIAGLAATGLALIGPRRLLRWGMRVVPLYSVLARL